MPPDRRIAKASQDRSLRAQETSTQDVALSAKEGWELIRCSDAVAPNGVASKFLPQCKTLPLLRRDSARECDLGTLPSVLTLRVSAHESREFVRSRFHWSLPKSV